MEDWRDARISYEASQRASRKRRWWTRSWAIITVSALLLFPVIYFTAGWVTEHPLVDAEQRERSSARQPRRARDGEQTAISAAGEAGQHAGSNARDGMSDVVVAGADSDAGDGETPPDTEALSSAAACARVVALRDNLQGTKVNPVAVYTRLLLIRRTARGTDVEPAANQAVAAIEGYASGSRDRDDVKAAAVALLDAC